METKDIILELRTKKGLSQDELVEKDISVQQQIQTLSLYQHMKKMELTQNWFYIRKDNLDLLIS